MAGNNPDDYKPIVIDFDIKNIEEQIIIIKSTAKDLESLLSSKKSDNEKLKEGHEYLKKIIDDKYVIRNLSINLSKFICDNGSFNLNVLGVFVDDFQEYFEEIEKLYNEQPNRGFNVKKIIDPQISLLNKMSKTAESVITIIKEERASFDKRLDYLTKKYKISREDKESVPRSRILIGDIGFMSNYKGLDILEEKLKLRSILLKFIKLKKNFNSIKNKLYSTDKIDEITKEITKIISVGSLKKCLDLDSLKSKIKSHEESLKEYEKTFELENLRSQCLEKFEEINTGHAKGYYKDSNIKDLNIKDLKDLKDLKILKNNIIDCQKIEELADISHDILDMLIRKLNEKTKIIEEKENCRIMFYNLTKSKYFKVFYPNFKDTKSNYINRIAQCDKKKLQEISDELKDLEKKLKNLEDCVDFELRDKKGSIEQLNDLKKCIQNEKIKQENKNKIFQEIEYNIMVIREKLDPDNHDNILKEVNFFDMRTNVKNNLNNLKLGFQKYRVLEYLEEFQDVANENFGDINDINIKDYNTLKKYYDQIDDIIKTKKITNIDSLISCLNDTIRTIGSLDDLCAKYNNLIYDAICKKNLAAQNKKALNDFNIISNEVKEIVEKYKFISDDYNNYLSKLGNEKFDKEYLIKLLQKIKDAHKYMESNGYKNRVSELEKRFSVISKVYNDDNGLSKFFAEKNLGLSFNYFRDAFSKIKETLADETSKTEKISNLENSLKNSLKEVEDAKKNQITRMGELKKLKKEFGKLSHNIKKDTKNSNFIKTIDSLTRQGYVTVEELENLKKIITENK
ncbi:MAG: hypothetical protein RsTaC01_0752 [Candidatus Paraimprobicoccus trichonymphae]|uniref:Uncharacterized protein n=1 Tax=Candidatus Paraimprobicoccus trichonymphae TaxID=3033793 RepID=A0AA48I4P7_9FIRM|nr:MAG: hypothetical protein RsTaC01_0752 [Candidatus Paraimprobicoccus trichonymphae]